MLRDYLQLPTLVKILCFGTLINRAGSIVIVFMTVYLSETLGYGVPFATVCVGMLGLGAMMGSILGGQLADQMGRRFVMLLALFGGSAIVLLLGQLRNPWMVLATIGLFGVVVDMYRPAATAMMADVVPVARRAHAFALMYISINLGFAVAPVAGGFLAEYSFGLLFFVDAVTMSAYGLIVMVFVSETLPQSNRSLAGAETQHQALSDSADHPSDALHDSDSGDSVADVPLGQAIRTMLTDKPFMLFCIAGFLTSCVFMQCLSTLPVYIREAGFNHVQFGVLMSLNGILIVLLQLPTTHWTKRFNSMSVMIAGTLFVAVGFGITGLGNRFWFLGLTIVLWTIGEILKAPYQQSIVTALAPTALRARYVGMQGVCFGLSVTIGAPIGGLVLTQFGPSALWAGAFVIAIAATACYVLSRTAITQRIRLAEASE